MDYATDGFQAFINKSDGLQSYTRQGLLGDRLLGMTANSNHGSVEESNVLAELLAYERRTRFTGEYMTKVDGATMHYGLEARSPFLDHILWEFASSLPFGLRLRYGYLKAILENWLGGGSGQQRQYGASAGLEFRCIGGSLETGAHE